MLKLSISCTRFESNYSSCTSKSNENICSSSGGAQEKGKKACKISVWQNSQFRLELVAKSKEGIDCLHNLLSVLPLALNPLEVTLTPDPLYMCEILK